MPDAAPPPEPDTGTAPAVADAVNNWVDRYAPDFTRPYLRLARADRPIGTWLLLWPCFWALTLALPLEAGLSLGQILWYAVLFGAGATVMRGAGCTYNDIVDADFDAQVARTRTRPIPSGAVSKRNAWIFLVALSLTGLVVLLQFNTATRIAGLASLLLIAGYPFMKRITYWPQAWLGLAFNWGALVGWTAVHGQLAWPPVLLYIAGIFWTLGYDTIYAHQDKEDDALIGVKSTALALGANTKRWLIGFYITFWIFLLIAGITAGLTGPFYLALPLVALHLKRQISSLNTDDPDNCLKIFRSNHILGATVCACIILGNTFQ